MLKRCLGGLIKDVWGFTLGVVLPNSPITMRPAAFPATSTSKNTFDVTVSLPAPRTCCWPCQNHSQPIAGTLICTSGD
eukprot:59360-Amorphochlora_amoeboformis.AAC.1